jgi:glycerol-3-phosphate dehydrogenase (NAD(P)+)
MPFDTPTSRSSPTPARDPVLVLGNGGWGTALALVLHQRGVQVRLWGHDADYTRLLAAERRNPKFLPGIAIPGEIRIDSNIEDLARGATVVFSVIPTQFLRGAVRGLEPFLSAATLFVSCSKGFERGSLELPSHILARVFPRAHIAVLSGPSHAEEVSRALPTTLVAASNHPETALEVQRLLNGPRFRVYSSTDSLGVEVGGAAKNVVAIAAGISDGLGFGDNARAGLLTRGLREITRLGVLLGARAETFAGLSGAGDLIATCTSGHSRNRDVGFRLGRGETLEGILASTEKVAEGVETTRSIHELAHKLAMDLPITREVHAVLFAGKPAREAVEALMSRETKEEIA